MSPIEKYLTTMTEPERAEFERIRKIVHQTVPDVEEGFSYGMPGFKHHNKFLLWVGAFKDHMSLFPASAPIAALKDKLKDYKMSKGTIQFTLDNPLPESLIKEILHMRLDDSLKYWTN